MTFKENLNRICRERGTKLTPVLKELGYSTSKATAINNGQIPKEDTLLELAKYLHCSVMDFFADEEDLKPKTEEVVFQDKDEQILIEGYRSLPKSQQYRLMAYYYALLEGRE